MNIKFYNKLSFKLILVISIILLINLTVFTLYTLQKLEKDLIVSNSQQAYNISDIIKRSTRYSMLLNRRYDVHQIINTIGNEAGVEKIRIYNKQGMIIFSTDTTELLHTVNMNTEACIACHVNGRTVANLPDQNRIRIFRNENGQRVMGLINPIENESDCSNADCHAHSDKQEILGVLDVVVSMEKMDAVVQSNTGRIVTNSILIGFLIAFFTWLFITYIVNKPIKKITAGIEELGRGNLNYKIGINSKDELGQMAMQFNDMSSKLDQAYKEIKEWSETLNNKVKEKTEELKKIYQQIIQIEKLASLGKLSATVAHELNNPLEGILTYSKLISKKLIKEQKSDEFCKILEYLELISDESSRCGRIVKDLLIFSHKEEEVFKEENLRNIVDKSVLLINHHLEMNNIKLIKDYSDDDVLVQCNSQKIQQALISLLINAIEAMNSSGKIILNLKKESQKVILRVIDEGSGIPEKDLPHIFEPFYTTKKEDSKGTGLGLAVAYGIVEQHKGIIEVENTSPKGTTFKIIFPLSVNKREVI